MVMLLQGPNFSGHLAQPSLQVGNYGTELTCPS